MTQKQVTEATDDWIDNYVFHLTHIVLYPSTIKANEGDDNDPKNR